MDDSTLPGDTIIFPMLLAFCRSLTRQYTVNGLTLKQKSVTSRYLQFLATAPAAALSPRFAASVRSAQAPAVFPSDTRESARSV